MLRETISICLLLLASVHSQETNKRDPKFFLVTSTTSTSLSTTTSVLQTNSPCFFADANIALVACPGKRKRSVLLDDNVASDIAISKRDRNSDMSIPAEIQDGQVAGSNRKARFFLYYMTTTITSTSTSTSTSSSFTATYTVSLLSCTPAGIHNLCGR